MVSHDGNVVSHFLSETRTYALDQRPEKWTLLAIMYVTTVPLRMRLEDGRSRNRMIPLGSIRSDDVAASRVFRVLFARLGFGFSALTPSGIALAV
jgi:hypothetical protein